MKLSRKVKLLILILMCSTVFFIYNKTNYNNISYTIIGDGLSLGINCYGQKDYGYGDYVKEYLKDQNKLKTYSSEYTSQEMTIERVHNTLLTNEKMKHNNNNTTLKNILRDTDYLTMTIGLNDLLYKLSILNEFNENDLNIVIKEIEASFNDLIKEIRKVYKKDIYIVGYYNIDINNKLYDKAIKKLNNIYKKNKEVTYISTFILSENKNIFLPNPTSYYPNYKGYQVISSKIIDKIEKKLEN